MTPRVQRILRISRNVLLGMLTLVVLMLVCVYFLFRASLPQLTGEVSMAALNAGLKAPVTLTRDERGTVQIVAQDTADAMRALGFVHAQERFFEMDLARRSAAGELSALLGGATLKTDKEKRNHRLRARMETAWKALPPAERETVSDYTAGVNAGLAALGARPWQYSLLRANPEPWREVDSLLVVAEMYFMLQARGIEERFAEIELRKRIGDRIFDWLKPGGGEWDAALDSSSVTPSALPAASEIDTRKSVTTVSSLTGGFREEAFAGSNNWAVGGALTADGDAILANDMHLGLGVPNIWFRAQMVIGEGAGARRLAGVTLPGVPSVVVGSNGHVAWGFTNSYGQWFDWVALPKSGSKTPLTTYREIVVVKGGNSAEVEVREAPWGPVMRSDTVNDYALDWVLYRDGAINFRASNIASVTSIDEAIAIAQQGGVPHQNFIVADQAGNIAWTIMGRIPKRDPSPPGSTRGRLATEATLPSGWLSPAQYPLVKNPSDARLWTANSRQLGGEGGAIIGDGGFDLGARARQIRDRLREKTRLSEADLYEIQLDAESRFLRRWAELAMSTIQAEPVGKLADIDAELRHWNGRADVDQVGHRIVRAFRQRVLEELWRNWLAAADTTVSAEVLETIQKRERFTFDGRFEYPVWQALRTRPMHLLPKPFTSWDEFLATQLDFVHVDLKQYRSLADATWGKRNTARIGHPFSRFMPFLSPFLDMPKTPLAGDNHMPRVAAPTFGASERMVVAPGHEERGIFTMPGGQSGHPLSPFFGAGHEAWLAGRATPLLAGDAQYTLRLLR